MALQMIRREDALAKVKCQHVLYRIWEKEQTQVEEIIDAALSVHQPDNRWVEYSRLKTMVAQIVGWKAPDPGLRGEEYYTGLIDFIDWLLPAAPSEREVL